jgi:aminoglycoside phosphotransferase (APT) family kinase protein
MTTAPGLSGFDLAGFLAWAAQHAPAVARVSDASLVSGGRSNLTFGVRDDAGSTWCVRRPPLGAVPSSAHDVLREYRILAALQGSGVPVPPVVASCDDPSVIGAPFYVMSFIAGPTIASAREAESTPVPVRRRCGLAVVEVMLAIHRVDLAASGLANLSRPGDYVARQLRRWRRQVGEDGLEMYPLLAEVAGRLADAIPEQQAETLVHGDLKLGNLIFRDSGDTVAAVLDWELCTLGDPLADLGWLLASWSEPGDTDVRIVTPPSRAGGFARREELIAAYGSGSPLRLDNVAYYSALAEWKWAAIDVGIHRRFTHGQMGDASIDLEAVTGEIDSRLHRSRALLAGDVAT